ncbi:MAG: peptidase dimerization domain-containing protein, partial [Planctomycetaceae bacterium]
MSPPVPDIDAERAVDLVTQLIAVPGGSGQEGQVAEFIRRRLRDAGVAESAVTTDRAHRRSPAGGETGNLILRLPGSTRGPRRLLMAHLDTVPICVGARPVRRGELLDSRDAHTGLGGDNRAGTGVVLTAALELARLGRPHPPLTLLWSVQEEIGLYGARYVSVGKLGRPKLCFNWDGGIPHQVTIGATGGVRLEIEVAGIASHAGVHPERGVSAAVIAGTALADLERNGWHGLVIKGRRSGTSNVGTIGGGEATNVVMPRLELAAEVRSHDRAFRLRIVEE